MNNLTVRRTLHMTTRHKGRKQLEPGTKPPEVPAGRVPRVSRLMALALRFERLLAEGVVKHQAELARLGHVTRARLTQIMNLLNLAPDIQKALLFLPRVERGKDPITERQLRPIRTGRSSGGRGADWSGAKRVQVAADSCGIQDAPTALGAAR